MAQIKQIGPSGQVSLGKEYAGRLVIVEQSEPGVWLIKTATAISDSDLRKQTTVGSAAPVEAKPTTFNLLEDVNVQIPMEKGLDENVREPVLNSAHPAPATGGAGQGVEQGIRQGAGQGVVPTRKP